MRGLIILLFLLCLTPHANAQNCSFANPTACGSPGVNNLAVGGTATFYGSANVNGALTAPVGTSTVTPTGGSVARTEADLHGDFVRATSFGANFDGVRVSSGGSMAQGSAVLTWSGGSFASTDVGKLIMVDGAGVNGRPLITTIASYQSATQVTLAATASSAVSTSIAALGYTAGPTLASAGSGYAPGDLITFTGGTATYQTVVQVIGTKVVSASVVSGGSGGTDGSCTITGTTGNVGGTTTLFQATGTVTGGVLGGALTVTVAGEYRDNPANLAAEPVTSNCGLSGATVSVSMGVVDILVKYPGAYSVRPTNPISQGSTTGAGSGATFNGVWNNTGTFHYGTDNATPIQNAINYCEGKVSSFAGGCTVLLPVGTGMTSGTFTINKQEVALYSLSKSVGFFGKNISAQTSQTFPTRILYAGSDNPGYILTEAPLLADGKRLAGNDIVGIMFDCFGTPGCGGVFLQSVTQSIYKAAISEPYPRAYTVSGAVTAGSNTVIVTDATGITLGQTFWSPNVLQGTYVSAISGNTLTLSSQAYGGGIADGGTVYLGGEGWRIDVLGGLNPSDSQDNYFWLHGRTLNTFSPCVTIGGSGAAGSPQYGNTSTNFFEDVSCANGVGDVVEANNSDHNVWRNFSSIYTPNSFNIGAAFISNGSLDPNNGSNRYNWFTYTPGRRGVIFRGTSVGGFNQSSFANNAQWVILSAAPRLVVDTSGGAQVCASEDSFPTVGCIGTQPVTAQYADSTTVGGNTRGNNAVDFQSTRTASTMVASGAQSTIAGGINNTASGAQSSAVGGSGVVASGVSSVAGGLNTTAQGTESVAVGSGTTASGNFSVASGSNTTASGANSFAGGNASTASGTASFAFGVQVQADTYGSFCTGSGGINGGGSSQTCRTHLRGSGSSASAIRVTADNGAANSANCGNMPLDSVSTLDITLTVYDRTTPTVRNTFSWHEPQAVLWVGNTNGTANLQTSGSPTTLSNGTLTTGSVSESADTTNACLNLSFTPPVGNTDTLDVYASITSHRVR